MKVVERVARGVVECGSRASK